MWMIGEASFANRQARDQPGAIYRRCLALLAEKSKRRLRAFPVPDEPEPVPPSAERVRL